MAWNEPGGGNRDPWSGGGGGGRGNQGPPDLDEVIRKLRSRLEGLFGGRGGRRGGDGEQSGGGGGGPGAKGVGVIVGLLVLGWLVSGIHIVDEGTRGVVTRFGDYVRTDQPGPHWHLPYPIESVQTVNVSERRTITVGYDAVAPNQTRPVLSEALMLTEDENIVNVQLAVQYEVGDPAQFLFEFVNPEQTLKEVTESALREIVGKRNMDFVLTEGRAEVANRTRELVEEVMSAYFAGIEVVAVVIQDVQPPEQVQDAFLDAIQAREDRERLINQAEAYRNEVIPQAQGQAAQILEQAQAYQAEVVNRAEGDASRFTQLVAEYRQAPDVTRDRLYLDTMERVLGRSGKVLIDVDSSQPLMYLPLDRMLRSGSSGGEGSGSQGESARAGGSAAGNQSSGGSSTSNSRLRMRETR
ncbi:FtsH protease activity modulator HflK [Sediminicurvatus halobius]|uniref:Protein HflK n=1 Tax=Sediminicurvatus halobius TaxID=2182432 RepID=A0A2U2N1D0_9GAMM|nr:FtsH protease activity modulator HflK [Spiribacter halobius]PWG62882.1 FtsH protease activity modulator HflK [Spiribacter halobius]UEX76967.1 FtsH protease activity modulator HflK [Spiribacter halobius]